MNALNNICYGVYILTTKTDKYNGCVINTLMQVTTNKISITINKDNYTTKQIEKSGIFNVSILDITTTFDLIKHFGFKSGKDIDKFDNFKDYKLSSNNLPYITKSTNSYISAKVVSKIDVGSHITFIAEITEETILSEAESLTYDYYHKHIKEIAPLPNKKVYICKICGYVYEGDALPDDFICPLCKHGASDFELKE